MKGSRRTFLAGASSAIAGLAVGGIPGSVRADGSEKETLRSAGVEDEFKQLRKQNKNCEAKQLLDDHNVEYDRVKVALPESAQPDKPQEQCTDPDEVTGGPEPELFDPDTASLTLYGTAMYDDLYYVDLNCQMYVDHAIDTPADRDGLAISWSDSFWEVEPGSNDSGQYCYNYDPGPQGALWQADDKEAYNAADGDPFTPYGKVTLQKKETGDVHNVYGHYCHSYYGDGLGAGGTAFNVTVGTLAVTFNGSIDTWKRATNTIEI